MAVARRFGERREASKKKQLDNYIDNVLSGDLGKLDINGGESMDTSNLLDVLDSDDEYTICAVRKKK